MWLGPSARSTTAHAPAQGLGLLQLLLRDLVGRNSDKKAANLPIAPGQCGGGARHAPIVHAPCGVVGIVLFGSRQAPAFQRRCIQAQGNAELRSDMPALVPLALLHLQVLHIALLRRVFPNHP